MLQTLDLYNFISSSQFVMNLCSLWCTVTTRNSLAVHQSKCCKNSLNARLVGLETSPIAPGANF